MIHEILVEASSTPEELKKLFRKKLMTGGAVIRLQQGLSGAEREVLFERFAPHAAAHNIGSLVLRELAAVSEPGEVLWAKLHALKIPNIHLELKSGF